MSATEAKGKGEAETKATGKDAGGDGGKGGGLKNWLPLIVTIVLMPLLAFVTTNFLILPKIVNARGGDAGEEHAESEAAHKEDGGHGEKKESPGHGEKKEDGKKEGKGHGTAGKGRYEMPLISCANCGKTSFAFARRTYVAHCSACGRPLTGRHDTTANPESLIATR